MRTSVFRASESELQVLKSAMPPNFKLFLVYKTNMFFKSSMKIYRKTTKRDYHWRSFSAIFNETFLSATLFSTRLNFPCAVQFFCACELSDKTNQKGQMSQI